MPGASTTAHSLRRTHPALDVRALLHGSMKLASINLALPICSVSQTMRCLLGLLLCALAPAAAIVIPLNPTTKILSNVLGMVRVEVLWCPVLCQ